MEALTRLVSDSLARYGFNRPIDPRRLQWSSWFLCNSPHSLLVVPSKPGIFAIAEEVMNLESAHIPGGADALVRPADGNVGTAALGCPAEQSGSKKPARVSDAQAALAAEGRRMLAVQQFSEDDDMAFTLDRMFTKPNAMRERLASGRCFVRFVVIEDEDQRRSICNALNQWLRSSSEKASGISAGFLSSLELARVERLSSPTDAATGATHPPAHTDSGSNRNFHCPQALPSGF